ncbi:hypothetical protein [Streptomyces goshikiensis]|uniref:hypothetical protein n=1 Tax=Streptomyces goshikiensis TaxID=1942 RepID=UPI00367F720A
MAGFPQSSGIRRTVAAHREGSDGWSTAPDQVDEEQSQITIYCWSISHLNTYVVRFPSLEHMGEAIDGLRKKRVEERAARRLARAQRQEEGSAQ